MGLEEKIRGARKRLNKGVFDISNSFTLTRPLRLKDAFVGGLMYGMVGLGFIGCGGSSGGGGGSDDSSPSNSAPLVEQSFSSVYADEDTNAYVSDVPSHFSDPDGDPLSYSVEGFNKISAVLSGSTIELSAPQDWNGNETGSVKASDGKDSVTTPLDVTFNPVNDAPVASDVSDSTDEDTSTNVGLSCSDVDGDSLTYSIVDAPSHGSVGTASGGSVDYTPDTNFNGSDSFSYKCNDSSVDSNTALVSMTVNPVNDSPSVSGVPDVSMDEDGVFTTSWSLDDYASDAEDSDSELSWTAAGEGNIDISIDSSTRQVTFAPYSDWNGTENVTFEACDTGGKCDSDSISAVVNAVNDRPFFYSPLEGSSVLEDSSYTLDMAAHLTDPESELLEIQIDTSPSITHTFSGGTHWVNVDDGSTYDDYVSFTPPADFNGDVGVVLTAIDPHLESCQDGFTLSVVPVNDDPVVTGVVVDNAVEKEYLTAEASASDVDSGACGEVTFTGVAPGSTLSNYGVGLYIDSATGVIGSDTVLPEGTAGANSLEVMIQDGCSGIGSYIKNFDVSVADTGNNAPIVKESLPDRTIDEDEVMRLLLSDYFSDPDGDDLTVYVWDDVGGITYDIGNGPVTTDGSTTQLGVMNLNDGNTADDYLSITHPENYNNGSLIRILVEDPSLATAIDEFVTEHTPVNDAPQFESVDITKAIEGEYLQGDADCYDPDIGDTVTYSKIDSTHPQAEVTSSGSIGSNDPLQSGSTVDYTISVQCCDQEPLCDQYTQPFEVQRPPSKPTSDSDSYGVYDNAPFPLEFDVYGSEDPNGDSFTYKSSTLPEGATLDPDTGHFTWDPTCDQDGTYSPSFYAEDSTGLKSTGYTVTIVVNDGC